MQQATKERDEYKRKYPKESKESKGQYNFIYYSNFILNHISRTLITKHSFCTCIDIEYDHRYEAFIKQYDELKTSIYMMAKKGYKQTKGPFNTYLIHFLAHTLTYPEGGKYENIDDVEYAINSLYQNNCIPQDLLPPLVNMLPDTKSMKELEMDDIAFQCRNYDKTWVKKVAPYVSDAMKEENQKNKQFSR